MQLVLLPGLDGTGSLFHPFIEALPQGTKIKTVPLPNHPLLDYKALTDYVKRQLPLEEAFIIIAESFSGPIAYLIAADPPGNLQHVVFVATFLHNPSKLLNATSISLLQLLLKHPLTNLFTRMFLLGKRANRELVSLFENTLSALPGALITHRLRLIKNLCIEPGTIRLACSYIRATNDLLVSAKNLHDYQDHIPNLKTFAVDGPHFLLQSNPHKCAQIITDIVNRAS